MGLFVNIIEEIFSVQIDIRSKPQPRPWDSDDIDIKMSELFELCKMGDISAMFDMALYMLDKCNETDKRALCRYEEAPERLGEEYISDYLNKYCVDCDTVSQYMMWIIRAAIYGNEKAKEIMDKCPYYKEFACIPYKFYEDEEGKQNIWSSNSLRYGGICDIPKKREDCDLEFDKKLGHIRFCYVSHYESPDDDGYGMEMDYDFIYYDEFFAELDINSESSREERIKALLKNEKAREAYWKTQPDCERRKYKILLRK